MSNISKHEVYKYKLLKFSLFVAIYIYGQTKCTYSIKCAISAKFLTHVTTTSTMQILKMRNFGIVLLIFDYLGGLRAKWCGISTRYRSIQRTNKEIIV